MSFGSFWPNFGWKRSHHATDASCREKIRVFQNLGFAKPMFWNPVLFTRTTGITKTTKRTQTSTNKGIDCWRIKNHLGGKKTNKQKTHKHFSDGPCGAIVPGTNPHPSQGQTGQNGNFTVEFNRERPVCPRDGSHFVPGTGPGLSQGRFLFVPNTVPPKMFMFIGLILA